MGTDSVIILPEKKAASPQILEPIGPQSADPSYEVSKKRQSLSDLFTIVSEPVKEIQMKLLRHISNYL